MKKDHNGVLTAVGCSIFAGLFTVGVKKAGFKVLAHLEQNDYGVSTSKLNHPDLQYHIGGPAKWPQSFYPGVDLVFCNPPCAVWSLARAPQGDKRNKTHTHWRDDERLQHAYDALELVKRYRPKVWIWESVPAALQRGRPFILEMAREGQRYGYACSVVWFNAMNVGCPQVRPRVFVVLHRVRFEPGPVDHDRVVTVREVWRDLPRRDGDKQRLKPSLANVLPHAKPGDMLWRVYDREFGESLGRTDRGFLKQRPSMMFRRLKLDAPAYPILDRLCHPTQQRQINVAEALRLCQLPDDWQFGSSTRTLEARRILLQRAVMPVVGEWIAEAARAAIVANKPVTPSRVADPLLYDLRPKAGPEISHLLEGPPTPSKAAGNRPTTERCGQGGKARTLPRGKIDWTPSPRVVERAKVIVSSKRGSGARIRELILQGKLDDEGIVHQVLREFPDRNTKVADVRWNRGKLKAAGYL